MHDYSCVNFLLSKTLVMFTTVIWRSLSTWMFLIVELLADIREGERRGGGFIVIVTQEYITVRYSHWSLWDPSFLLLYNTLDI